MPTPKYGPNKLEQYRLKIINEIDKTPRNKKHIYYGLGGAHALEGVTIENAIIKRNAVGSIVSIVDSDLKNIKILKKSGKRWGRGSGRLYYAYFGNVRVELHHNTLNRYHDYAAKINRIHTIYIPDFYNTLTKENITDLTKPLKLGILANNCIVAVTTCEPRRTKNTESCQRIAKYDGNPKKDYFAGFRNITRKLFNSRGHKVKTSTFHKYNNKDINVRAYEMAFNLMKIERICA